MPMSHCIQLQGGCRVPEAVFRFFQAPESWCAVPVLKSKWDHLNSLLKSPRSLVGAPWPSMVPASPGQQSLLVQPIIFMAEAGSRVLCSTPVFCRCLAPLLPWYVCLTPAFSKHSSRIIFPEKHLLTTHLYPHLLLFSIP